MIEGSALECQTLLESAGLYRFNHRIKDEAGNSHPRCILSNQATLYLLNVGTLRHGAILSHSWSSRYRSSKTDEVG